MSKRFEQLFAGERATIMMMAQEGKSLRAMARTLYRSPSTISREWRRHVVAATHGNATVYDAKRAGQEARRRRLQPRRLGTGTPRSGELRSPLRGGAQPPSA